MKTIKMFIAAAGGAAAALLLAQTVQAQSQMTGEIGVESNPVTVDTSGDLATATQVTGWSTPLLDTETGSFSALMPGLDPPSLTAPWSFNSGAIPGFLTVGGFTFDLIQSAIASQGGNEFDGYVTVNGTGVIRGTGYSATPADLTFMAQEPARSAVITLTAEPTPEPGTVLLLGAALGLMLCRGRSLRRA